MQTKRGVSRLYQVLAVVWAVFIVLVLRALLGPAVPASLAMPLTAAQPLDISHGPDLQAAGPVTFTGQVQYHPALASVRAQSGISVTLYGYELGIDTPIELGQTSSASDGSFQLTIMNGPVWEKFEIRVGLPRGFVPGSARSPSVGPSVVPNTVVFSNTVSGYVTGTQFILFDPQLLFPLYHDRYLIVTTEAIAPVLTDFINYKRWLGFDVIVKTVEELDPGGLGGNHLRTAIRSYEQSLWSQADSLTYVLLIGTHDTIPFLTVNPNSPDLSRIPDGGPWQQNGACEDYDVAPNNCGWPTDWFYVDLTSDWDSNGDGIMLEGAWADPDAIQEWRDASIVPSDFAPDDPPNFDPDVYVGRIPADSPASVQLVLQTIMDFEQDGGEWKQNTLLAGAMMSVGGLAWDPPGVFPLYPGMATYVPLPAPTDTGYLMEQVWSDFLSSGNYNRVRLYEQDSPYGLLPPRTSSFAVDDALNHTTMLARWSSQAFGLVKIAGHGYWGGITRLHWYADLVTDQVPQNPSMPLGIPHPGYYELDSPDYLDRDDASQLAMPAGKVPVLMVMGCSTGVWNNNSNMGATLLSEGSVAAWIGGTGTVGYQAGWQDPSHGSGQTIDYFITEGLIDQGLPIGDAVWEGLAHYFVTANGSSWGNGYWEHGFINWDLYGDPSMEYWGSGSDWQAPWPMFHYDEPGYGETALLGPGADGTVAVNVGWSADISPTLTGTMPSPVIGDDGVVVIGDGGGVVRAFGLGGYDMWSYQTGGAIVNAAALSVDGTAYVKSQNGVLYAIDDDGTLLWSDTVGESEASPKIGVNGTIYVGGSDNEGPEGSTRYFLASYRPDGTRLGINLVDDRITTAPAISHDGERVWVGTAAGTIYRFAEGESTSSWSLTPGYAIGNGLALAESDDRLLVPSANGDLMGFDTDLQVVVWTLETGDAIYSAPALGANDQVFVGSRDGKVYAVRLWNGASLWQAEYDTGGPIDSSPALDALNVYVVGGGSPATIYAINRLDGTLRWSVTRNGSSVGGSSPAIGHSRMLYVAMPAGGAGPSAMDELVAIEQANWVLPPLFYEEIPRPDDILLHLTLGDDLAQTRIERRVPGGDWAVQDTLSPGVTEFIDTGVAPGQIYQYRGMAMPNTTVRWLRSSASAVAVPSDYSEIVTVQALPEPPDPPSDPIVFSLSATELRLTWTTIISDVASIHIYRQGPTETVSATLATVPGGVSLFDDGGLEPASEYSYWLRASNAGGDSVPSGVGQGTTLSQTLPAPSAVTVTPLDNMAFEVCWEPGALGLHSIVARRPWGLVTPEYVATVDPGQDCYTDTYDIISAFDYWVRHTNSPPTDESDWARSALIAAPGYDMGYEYIYLPVVMRSS